MKVYTCTQIGKKQLSSVVSLKRENHKNWIWSERKKKIEGKTNIAEEPAFQWEQKKYFVLDWSIKLI